MISKREAYELALKLDPYNTDELPNNSYKEVGHIAEARHGIEYHLFKLRGYVTRCQFVKCVHSLRKTVPYYRTLSVAELRASLLFIVRGSYV